MQVVFSLLTSVFTSVSIAGIDVTTVCCTVLAATAFEVLVSVMTAREISEKYNQ
jgi:hypothetical protein